MDNREDNSEYGQQFNLRWNNHSNNVLQVFMEHFITENLVDITLSCEGQFIKVHKMILSACSPYFQEAIRLHSSQREMIIVFNQMRFSELKLMVEFMYRGEIKVLESEIDGLLTAAELLQIKGLSNVRKKYERGDIHTGENECLSTLQNLYSNIEKEENNSSYVETTNATEIAPPAKKKRKIKSDTSTTTSNTNPHDDVNTTSNTVQSKKIRANLLHEKNLQTKGHNSKLSNKLSDSALNEITSKNSKREISSDKKSKIVKLGKKIPRPPNAFMVFANEWRRRLAGEHPEEKNSDISVRLGFMWKKLNDIEKAHYYEASRRADAEHKIKYPGYYYSPKEARKRKKTNTKKTVSPLLNNLIEAKTHKPDNVVVKVESDETSLLQSDVSPGPTCFTVEDFLKAVNLTQCNSNKLNSGIHDEIRKSLDNNNLQEKSVINTHE